MWIKKGLSYTCDYFGTGYAQDAFIDKLNNNVWRIYYSARTKDVVSYPFYIDVEAGNPSNILYEHETPLLVLGQPGTFDDSGITMTSIVRVDEHKKYLYYCGWNRKVSVSYSLAIGCAEVIDDSVYRKLYEGPVMERSINDPICVSAPDVLYDNGIFRMWYISFTGWPTVSGKTEPIYVVKHAVSKDGIVWKTDKHICIDSSYDGESIGRPWVIKDNGIYKMWFSSRGLYNYREKNGQHYMIGYAESKDGLVWERRPDLFNFPLSENGWDSEMLGYCSVTKHDDQYFMLYNGNSFGKDGFGYAIKK